VVSHAPSRNYCRHQGRAAADCARDRSVGLLADKAPSDAVREGTSLTLGDPTRGGRMLEHVAGVQSLDVRALLAQLVGSVQELSAQLHSKDAQIVVLAKQNQELGHQGRPTPGSPPRGARYGGGAAVRTSVKIILRKYQVLTLRKTSGKWWWRLEDGVESSFLQFLRRNRARKRVLAGVLEKESGSKYWQGYTPFTTFPLFLLLFLLFFFPSPPPSASGGEKLPGQALLRIFRKRPLGWFIAPITDVKTGKNRSMRF